MDTRLPSDQALTYALLRLTLGVTMLVHGANRIAVGVQQFAAGIDRDFAHTFLPASMVHLFALTLPFFEAAIGVLLVTGLLTRFALVLGALITLVFGMTLREQFHDRGRSAHLCRDLFRSHLPSASQSHFVGPLSRAETLTWWPRNC